MDPSKPLAAVSLALLAFVAAGALVDLLGILAGNLAALAVVVLLVAFGVSSWATGTSHSPSTPYWGR